MVGTMEIYRSCLPSLLNDSFPVICLFVCFLFWLIVLVDVDERPHVEAAARVSKKPVSQPVVIGKFART